MICVGVEGNVDFLPKGPFPQAPTPCFFLKSFREGLYKAANTLHRVRTDRLKAPDSLRNLQTKTLSQKKKKGGEGGPAVNQQRPSGWWVQQGRQGKSQDSPTALPTEPGNQGCHKAKAPALSFPLPKQRPLFQPPPNLKGFTDCLDLGVLVSRGAAATVGSSFSGLCLLV